MEKKDGGIGHGHVLSSAVYRWPGAQVFHPFALATAKNAEVVPRRWAVIDSGAFEPRKAVKASPNQPTPTLSFEQDLA